MVKLGLCLMSAKPLTNAKLKTYKKMSICLSLRPGKATATTTSGQQ